MAARRTEPIINQFWARVSVAAVAVLMLTVWEHVKAVRLDAELKMMRREADRITYENGRMQKKINEWVSLSNLDVVARRDYGMAPVDPKHVIGFTLP